jgi:hypothetical protein
VPVAWGHCSNLLTALSAALTALPITSCGRYA